MNTGAAEVSFYTWVQCYHITRRHIPDTRVLEVLTRRMQTAEAIDNLLAMGFQVVTMQYLF